MIGFTGSTCSGDYGMCALLKANIYALDLLAYSWDAASCLPERLHVLTTMAAVLHIQVLLSSRAGITEYCAPSM